LLAIGGSGANRDLACLRQGRRTIAVPQGIY